MTESLEQARARIKAETHHFNVYQDDSGGKVTACPTCRLMLPPVFLMTFLPPCRGVTP